MEKVPAEAVSQAAEHVEWSILHYGYKFHMVITCCLQGKNDSHESCSKSLSQIWTFAMSSMEKKWDQHAVVQFYFLLGYSPT